MSNFSCVLRINFVYFFQGLQKKIDCSEDVLNLPLTKQKSNWLTALTSSPDGFYVGDSCGQLSHLDFTGRGVESRKVMNNTLDFI